MPLIRIAYVSRSLIGANEDVERRQIADILLTSRRNNEAAKITGALLATADRFAQALEGERDAVEATYARIAGDPRHADLILLLTETIDARQFPQWAMAYIGPSQSAEEAVQRVAGDLPQSKRGKQARALVAFMSQVIAASGSG